MNPVLAAVEGFSLGFSTHLLLVAWVEKKKRKQVRDDAR